MSLEDSPQLPSKIGGLEANLAGALCYAPVSPVNLIASALFAFTEPKENKLLRFHGFQGLLMIAAMFVGGIGGSIVLLVVQVVLMAAVDEMLGALVSLVLSLVLLVFVFGLLALDIFAMIKAFQGSYLKIPIIGQIAERLA